MSEAAGSATWNNPQEKFKLLNRIMAGPTLNNYNPEVVNTYICLKKC